MPVYNGPSDVFIYKENSYRVGDNIPMNRDEVAHHMQFGHRFEGNDPALETGVILGFTPKPELAMPFDDRGQKLVDEKAIAAAEKAADSDTAVANAKPPTKAATS